MDERSSAVRNDSKMKRLCCTKRFEIETIMQCETIRDPVRYETIGKWNDYAVRNDQRSFAAWNNSRCRDRPGTLKCFRIAGYSTYDFHYDVMIDVEFCDVLPVRRHGIIKMCVCVLLSLHAAHRHGAIRDSDCASTRHGQGLWLFIDKAQSGAPDRAISTHSVSNILPGSLIVPCRHTASTHSQSLWLCNFAARYVWECEEVILVCFRLSECKGVILVCIRLSEC